MAEGSVDGVAAAARSAEKKLFSRPGKGPGHPRTPVTRKVFVAEIGARKHGVKGEGQLGGERTLDAHAQVAPTGVDAVTLVFGSDIEATDKSHTFIAHQKLAMIPNADAADRDGIEMARLSAGIPQRAPEFDGQFDGPEGVGKHPHADAAALRAHQRIAELFSRRSRSENVNLQANGGLRRVDGCEHRGKDFAPGSQPLTGCPCGSGCHHTYNLFGDSEKRNGAPGCPNRGLTVAIKKTSILKGLRHKTLPVFLTVFAPR